jgi:hypothetical protein
MSSAASEIDPAAEPHFVVVDESSGAGGSEEEAPPEAAVAEVVVETEASKGEVKEEEEGECSFCLYMKGGGCKEAFVAWEECAAQEGSDMVERCHEATFNLVKCMQAHADYYEPVLEAEKKVSDKVEADIAAADGDKSKGEESAPSPATEETKKEEAVVESAAFDARANEEVVQQAASSTPAEEAEKEEAIVQKVDSLSLGN